MHSSFLLKSHKILLEKDGSILCYLVSLLTAKLDRHFTLLEHFQNSAELLESLSKKTLRSWATTIDINKLMNQNMSNSIYGVN